MQRRTKQRVAIVEVFEEAERPLSPTEIGERAEAKVAGISSATVYRALNRLLKEGMIDTVAIPDHPPRYEKAGLKHHHHCVCTRCARVFEVPGCSYGGEKNLPDGFVVEGHEIIVYGRCRRCSDG